MIKSKDDYKRFLKNDQKSLGAFTKFPLLSNNIMIPLTEPCWKFQRLLRKLEYYTNCKHNIINNIYIYIYIKK